jgi:hypothetical protein
MVNFISTDLSLLSKQNRVIWPYLSDVHPEFVLYGDMALLLRTGFAPSQDYLFLCNSLDTNEIFNWINNTPLIKKHFMSKYRWLTNHYIFNVKLFVNNFPNCSLYQNSINMNIMGDFNDIPGCIVEPDIIDGINLKIASIPDLYTQTLSKIINYYDFKYLPNIIQFIKLGYSLEFGISCYFAISSKSYPIRIPLIYDIRQFFLNLLCRGMIDNEADYIILENSAFKINDDNVEMPKLYLRLYDIHNNRPFNPDKSIKQKYYSLKQYKKCLVWYH